jgi:hypothetical protein
MTQRNYPTLRKKRAINEIDECYTYRKEIIKEPSWKDFNKMIPRPQYDKENIEEKIPREIK